MAFFPTYFFELLTVGHILFAGASVIHILLFKTDPRAAFGWLAFVVVLPLAGPILYWLFGVNRVRKKARGESVLYWDEIGALPALDENSDTHRDPLRRIGWRITGRSLVVGNTVRPLFNGEGAYPEMLDAIAGARSEILLATFIFDRDPTGQRFVEALCQAQQRGVEVCALIDDVGRRYSFPSILPTLLNAQIPTRCFMPLTVFPPSISINMRNHRKILIVDREVAFAGGMNIGDRQLAKGGSRNRSSDLHFRLQGPIVSDLFDVFVEDWETAGGDALPKQKSNVADAIGSECACRVVPDGPGGKMDHLSLVIEGVISAAKHSIVILTPYFLPENRLVGALQSAALRGVNVTIVLPEKNNFPIVRWALRHSLWELLNVGIVVHEQPPPFAHAKCLLIDDEYALVGSANLDERSLRLNFELGIEVFDSSLNEKLRSYVENILVATRTIHKTEIMERGIFVRLRDALAALFSPYL